MAAIDKTYVNREEYFEALEWAKSLGTITLENGYKFNLVNYIRFYNTDLEHPENNYVKGCEEFVLWNAPHWLSRWLWVNCPLESVREHLRWEYSQSTLDEFESWQYHNPKNNFEFGKQHYTFLKVPNWRWCKYWMAHGHPKKKRQPLHYTIEIIAPNRNWQHDLGYDMQTDTWVDKAGYLPWSNSMYREYKWYNYHKNIPNKKSIIRELRRWYIPKGYIIKVHQINYKGLDFEILVK